MDDRSWIYQDSPQGLQMMNYYNWVQGFINYAMSNPRNINGCGIKYPCKRCKNKKFLDLDVVRIHLLQKGFMEKYLCWYALGELFVPHKTMIKKMVELIFSASYMKL